MTKLNLSKDAFRLLPNWLRSARIFWWFILSLFVVSFVGDWISVIADTNRQAGIRYSGLIFEILGLLAVAFGLNNKLDLLDQKGIGTRIKEWGRACPLLRRDTVVGIVGAESGAIGGDLRGRIGASINESMPLEDKVKFLIEMYDRLDTELGKLSGQHQKDVADIKAEIKKIQTRLADEIKAVATKSAKAQVGDIGWEFAGLLWVLIGVIFATVPEGVYASLWWLIEFFVVFR